GLWPGQGRSQACFYTINVHEREAGSIPNLVSKSAIALGPALVERNVSSRCSHRGQRKPCRIRPKALNDFQGIDDIALGLRHLLPLGEIGRASCREQDR